MKSITKALLLGVLCIGLLCGCTAKPETFSKGEISLTLTSGFDELKQEGAFAVYGSRDEAVMIQKEDFSTLADIGISKDSTLTDYANAVIHANELRDTTVEERDGVVCFIYEATTGKKTYAYLATVQKSDDAFWLIQFSAIKDKFDEKEATFLTYAKSVTLS